MNLNKVFLIGRLTSDPQLKALPSGQSIVNFRIATDRYFTDKDGNKQKQTEFHNVVLFGRLAEIASQYLNKGSLAFIEGRITTRNWDDSSGNKRYRTEIVAERMQLGPKSQQGKQPFSPPQDQIPPQESQKSSEEKIPVIEENEIDVKDIPF